MITQLDVLTAVNRLEKRARTNKARAYERAGKRRMDAAAYLDGKSAGYEEAAKMLRVKFGLDDERGKDLEVATR